MNFKKKLSELIANLNKGFDNQTIEIKHKYNKQLQKILELLVKEGIIYGFEIDTNLKDFVIFLKLQNNNTQKVKLLLQSKVTSPKYIKKYPLASLIYKDYSSTPVTTSNLGLISNTKLKVNGGEFLFTIKINKC